MRPLVELVRDDEGGIALAERSGWIAPPMFERIDGKMGVHFRRMVMGWVVFDHGKNLPVGWVMLAPSWDLQDYELSADGGWKVNGARKLFRWLFEDMKQTRVSARCRPDNARHVRVLKRFGFVEEGRRVLPDHEQILFRMTREECRLINSKEAHHGSA